jgi:uncharacterized SAM-binding protein YcdF (DUF218 family)
MNAEVIIVLGAALNRDGSLGPSLRARVDAGIAAHRAGHAPLLLMTGLYEADAMKRAALVEGVAESAILVERSARSTRENALASAELMRRHELGRALLVTQPFHMRRSLATFRRVGIEVAPLFAQETAPLGLRVREWGALVVYGLRGWLGCS